MLILKKGLFLESQKQTLNDHSSRKDSNTERRTQAT